MAPLVVIGLGACALVVFGVIFSRDRGPATGWPFLGLGAAVLLMLAVHVWRHTRQVLTIRPDGILWEGPLGKRDLAWQEITEFEDRPLRMLPGRRARIFDGHVAITLESGLYPEYLQIVSLIVVARRRHAKWLLINKSETVKVES